MFQNIKKNRYTGNEKRIGNQEKKSDKYMM